MALTPGSSSDRPSMTGIDPAQSRGSAIAGTTSAVGDPASTTPIDERWQSLSGAPYRGPDWSSRTSEAYWKEDRGPGPRVMAASTLEGDDIVNEQGEDLGTLKEIMIDVPTGRIAYAVLSSGGFLGIGDKLFAIPWNALRMDPPNHRFILNIARERLAEAPGFDKDNWPTMADQQWAMDVHSYYGARPYWE